MHTGGEQTRAEASSGHVCKLVQRAICFLASSLHHSVCQALMSVSFIKRGTSPHMSVILTCDIQDVLLHCVGSGKEHRTNSVYWVRVFDLHSMSD